VTNRIVASTIGIAIAAGSPVASAQGEGQKPSKDQCLDAHENAQLLEREGKLIEARGRFAVCAHPACPGLVRNECAPRVAELGGKIASVRLEVRGQGDVTLDDAPVPAAAADGTIEVDPGAHTFRLRAADGRISEQRVTLDAGKRGVQVVLSEPAPAAAPTEPAPRPAPDPGKRKIPTPAYVLGGVAVVGLAGFVGFAIAGRAKQSELDDCKPDCKQSDYDDMQRRYLFADISLGVAAIAGGLAAYVYFKDRKRQEREGGAYVGAAPTPTGGVIRAGVTF
jgi:hypothetical protein